MRRSSLTSLFILAPLLAAGQQTHPFLLGAEWQVDASPAVKELFWESGCNFARLTGGGYGWVTESHRRALKELNEHGVRVLLQLGSHYPDGSFFDLKDAYFVDQNGKTGVPNRQSWAVEYDGQAWPQYSYASEPFRNLLQQNFKTYFQALGPLPNVEAILLHNEPGFFWLNNRTFDYNPSSIARFRKWLPSQYGSIADLNQTWGQSYNSFDEVQPPHDPSANQAAWLDWRRANVAVVQDFLEWERGVSRQAHPEIPTTTNLSGPIDNWYPIRLGNNYQFSEGLDIASIDIYPGAEWSSRFFPAYTMDMTRGAANGKRLFVAECESYAPEHFPKLSDQERADRLASDLWTYIGHGANAISLWTWNGQDGFKLTSGKFNERIAAVRDTAYAAKMLHLGEFSKPARQVALVVDPNSYLLFKTGEETGTESQKSYSTALGLYGALAQAHVEADVLSVDQLRTAKDNPYRAMILASAATMDAALATRLATFVKGGGLLIADGSVASRNLNGAFTQTRPGFGLDQLFGLKVTAEDLQAAVSIRSSNSTFAGVGRDMLALNGAKPLGQFDDGQTASTIYRTGKGAAIFLGTNPGTPNSEGGQPGLAQALSEWLKTEAGISSAEQIDGADEYLDLGNLTDSKQNRLIVISNPPNRADPNKPYSNVRISVPNRNPQDQVFLFSSPVKAGARVQTGPLPLSGNSWVIPSLVSHAVILTAHDHSPLLSTDAPEATRFGSEAEIEITVFNPSPRSIKGSLSLGTPQGWNTTTAKVFLGPYQHSTFALRTRPDRVQDRVPVKAVLDLGDMKVESIPFDLHVLAQSN
jgi:hypothetical protein